MRVLALLSHFCENSFEGSACVSTPRRMRIVGSDTELHQHFVDLRQTGQHPVAAVVGIAESLDVVTHSMG